LLDGVGTKLKKVAQWISTAR